ncbi:sestrin-3 [Chanos chanos]|uniref:Sestrin-3 n=1 Tax=Chanos chanos TaxID=29144 RepID=A0A6J2VWW5_CHACN|nr:sestrin-3-like [Chanos chanos]
MTAVTADPFSSSDPYKICAVCQKVTKNKERGTRVPEPFCSGPSAFIPEEEILEAWLEDPPAELLLADQLDHLTQVMGLHPHYLKAFLRCQFYLLKMDGPLPLHYRHYIAIMAAARHQCWYLVRAHMREFYRRAVCLDWLKGLQFSDQKLQKLNEINKILAHRPWLITKEHIQALVKTGESSWSLAELVHAVVLLAHFHALASFVFGSGINPETPSSISLYCTCDPTGDEEETEFHSFFSTSPENEPEALMETMKRLQEEREREEEEASEEEMFTRFEKEKKESLLVGSGDFDKEVMSFSRVSRFVEDSDFGYKDFARHGEDNPPTFRAQDYSWEDHGFSLVNRLYSDIGHLLEDRFQTACDLTYYNMASHEGVDTSMLRRALFNYVHCMYGIRYDDYDYGEVNQLLERSLKVYIKTVTCYPERTTRRMYDSYWHQFRHSEKVHVNLLLMEARMQAELLYALRAITRYMT